VTGDMRRHMELQMSPAKIRQESVKVAPEGGVVCRESLKTEAGKRKETSTPRVPGAGAEKAITKIR